MSSIRDLHETIAHCELSVAVKAGHSSGANEHARGFRWLFGFLDLLCAYKAGDAGCARSLIHRYTYDAVDHEISAYN